MNRYPRIDRPCPYRADLSAVLDNDHCRVCKRDVIDLGAMSEEDRSIFLASCEGEVCVRYSVRVPAPVAAAALAAAALAIPGQAAAQDVASGEVTIAPAPLQIDEEELTIIAVGGIHDAKAAKLVDNPLDATLPTLPVVYEDEAPAAKQAV